jgi:predicted RNA-binding Zn-ribbon protein involved in translation (DUF1610 family)
VIKETKKNDEIICPNCGKTISKKHQLESGE